MKVLIVGYGEMGHALEYLLRPRHDVVIWNRSPVAGIEPVALETAAAAADIVIYCIPVAPLAGMAERLLPVLRTDSLSVTFSKGLDDAGRTAPQVLRDVYGDRLVFATLYGPMISEEIRAGRPGFALSGMHGATADGRMLQLFAGSSLYLQSSADITGMAWSSVLKNVYAILIGAADALGLGNNVRGFLVTAAIDEMQAIVERLGGVGETCLSLAGIGDLVTTATSPDSRHHALGGRLARGETGTVSGEGIHTLAMVRERDLFAGYDYPLFNLVATMVDDPGATEARIGEFIARQFR